jgi:hypothetical protein
MIEGISRAPEQGRAGRGAVTIDALDISSHSFLCGLIDLSTLDSAAWPVLTAFSIRSFCATAIISRPSGGI